MELYGFMEREKKIPSYFFIITKKLFITRFNLVDMVFSVIRVISVSSTNIGIFFYQHVKK